MASAGRVRVGTSSFTANGWQGIFYPAKLKPASHLAYYAKQFDTVEIDSTFYGTPADTTVKKWAELTPPHFLFSAKVPQIITHERCLQNCDADLSAFLCAMEHLGPRLGVLLFQFPYFSRQEFATHELFLQKLEPFLKTLPSGFRFAVEIRNKDWLTPAYFALLKEHQVSSALVDHPYMPKAEGYFTDVEPVTSGVAYVRLLGDRYAIEEQTKTWDKTIIDRSREYRDCTTACEKLTKRGVDVFVYINNHYAGHAPAGVREFLQYWRETHPEEQPVPKADEEEWQLK
jgi:uncharacterized protein YecE (DUF72 family)